ncbi:hypothetical protein AB838_04695 [Rhodobacteraceae bacterium (ex Bugula neritina AB1)]|nr:hypothetical protein AB838_04695 [Rhodobacteraceae bacterium (ex Bugula neritina AB1)]
MTATGTEGRRQARKRGFRRAALILGAGGAVALAALLADGPLLALLLGIACLIWAAWQLYQPGGVPILVYHSVSPDAGWLPWARNTSVRPEVLRCHLAALRAGGWRVIATQELIQARQSGTALPRRTVVLQFDDAYLDNYLFAAPILREFSAPAMFFASTDFIAEGESLRQDARSQGAAAWAGYMNAAELRALDADPLFTVEAHGTNHARIPVSDAPAETVQGDDWKPHAPLSWAKGEGNKSLWYKAATAPEILAPGCVLPCHDSALAGRWWRDGRAETEAEFRARVTAMLTEAHGRLETVLGRAPNVMAWPFDRCDEVSLQAAYDAGFTAVTGGNGENRVGEAATVLSRIHLQDHAFGPGPLWLEALAVRARAQAASGHWIWHVLVALAARRRRRLLGASGYGAP